MRALSPAVRARKTLQKLPRRRNSHAGDTPSVPEPPSRRRDRRVSSLTTVGAVGALGSHCPSTDDCSGPRAASGRDFPSTDDYSAPRAALPGTLHPQAEIPPRAVLRPGTPRRRRRAAYAEGHLWQPPARQGAVTSHARSRPEADNQKC